MTYRIIYEYAYTGGIANHGIDFAAYERGLMARRVAEWCGVSLI